MSFIVKITTLTWLFDLFAPHSCRGCSLLGKALCDCCKNDIITHRRNICPECKTLNPTDSCQACPHIPATFVAVEHTNLIRQLIHDYKYHSARSLAQPLSEIINASLPSIDGDVTIVPLPTAHHHVRQRGFDHTLALAKHLSRLRPNWRAQAILLRSKNTTQVGADRKTRIKQADSAFQINSRIPIDPHTTYLLLDDVWTTGASMKAAYKKLQQAGAKKIMIAVLALSRI